MSAALKSEEIVIVFSWLRSITDLHIYRRPFDLLCKVLFQYKDSRWAVVLRGEEDVYQNVKDYYNISRDAVVIFQTYSDEWAEWIDVKVEEICNKDKVRVIVVEKASTKKTEPNSYVCLQVFEDLC